MDNEQHALYASYAAAAGMSDIGGAFDLVYRLWDEDHHQTGFPRQFAERVYREAAALISRSTD